MQNKTLPGLNVKFAGLDFKSPIGVGVVEGMAGKDVTPEESVEHLLRYVELGAGYLYAPSCAFLTEETEKKLQETAIPEEISEVERKKPAVKRRIKIETRGAPYGLEAVIGAWGGPLWHNAETVKSRWPYRKEFTEILKKRKPKDVPLIASVVGLGELPDTYVDSAKKWEELGADLIELNLSCPTPPTMHGAVEYYFKGHFPARMAGALIGDNPDLVERITREVAKAVSIPVGVKISPETGFPRVVGLAKRIRGAGAKYIQAVNCGIGIAPPDIYNRGKPIWPFADSNPLGAVTGPWLRQVLYKDVAVINRWVPGIDIAASGGLVTPEHCVEVMMLGASLTQLCTGILLKGTSLIRQCDRFLKKFMVEQGYQTVEDIIGLGQQYIRDIEDADFMAGKVVAELDEAKCTGCGLCLNTFCAVTYSENGRVRINTERCTGCARCTLVCPEDAIKLVAKAQSR